MDIPKDAAGLLQASLGASAKRRFIRTGTCISPFGCCDLWGLSGFNPSHCTQVHQSTEQVSADIHMRDMNKVKDLVGLASLSLCLPVFAVS